MKAQGTSLKDARIVFYGAGSSAVGVATMIAQLLVKECGLTFEEAKKVFHNCNFCPKQNLLFNSARRIFVCSSVFVPICTGLDHKIVLHMPLPCVCRGESL